MSIVSTRAPPAVLVPPWELLEVQTSDMLRMDHVLDIRDACFLSVKEGEKIYSIDN